MRRFLAFTNEAGRGVARQVDEWSLWMTSEKRLAPSTNRGYQGNLRLFSEFLTDARYGWVAECEQRFGPGVHPVPICHEWNTIAHLNSYEGRPEARPFTREELQRFLDYADDQVERAVRAKRKGALAAYRDATLFKVIYGWGLFSRVQSLRQRDSLSLCSSEADVGMLSANRRAQSARGFQRGRAGVESGHEFCGWRAAAARLRRVRRVVVVGRRLAVRDG